MPPRQRQHSPVHKNPELLHRLAPAKLNLYLHVLGRAHDYHQIESLAVFTHFGDRLEARPGADISLRIEGPFAAECGPLQDNLVMRAAHALAAHVKAPAGAALTLYKNLPVASGLGGGSSDAAAALHLLVQLWNLDIEDSLLSALALALGADVPVCLRRTPSLMHGIGEVLHPAPALPSCFVLLINPGVTLSTRAVFEKLNGRFGEIVPPLPRNLSSAKKLAGELKVRRNDLQNPAIELAPEIQTVLKALGAQKGCLLARMSGSGATCFALFASSGDLADAARNMASRHPSYWMVQTRLA